ncbi:MAG TPA: ATP-binding protein, partial [Pyrinomonadaceae bacterium]|nr:ATP-binding protein [Pyrinomonadaceae bacterium]
PFDLKLRRARGEVEKQLYLFDHLPQAQTERGRSFRQDVALYIESTKDAEQYSLEGYKSFRPIEDHVDSFINEINQQQFELRNRRATLVAASARQIRLLTWGGVALSFLIAAATIWEVQRRFRQMRRSLEESRRERQFSSQMLEGMVSAVAAIDGRGALRSANAAFFQLFPEASVGTSVHDATHAPDALKMFAAATSSSSRVEQVTYHGRWTLNGGADGEERTFEVYASPLEIDGGHGQIMTLVDVTKTVATETELRHKASLAAVGQAAAQVAHEIKNPLGSIRLGVAMLRDMTEAGEAHETIDLVERGIDHLNKLTVDVTQFSREKELSLERVNLHALLDSSLELVADQVRAKRAPVERRYASAALEGELDADQLRQVFVNLFANALDAGEENSPLPITTAPVAGVRATGGNGAGASEPRARVTITDRGRGMDAKTRARIFEPFYTTKKRGTGLGLAIVKKIVEQHGGTITVESAPGEGTSFHVELPLTQN